MKRHATAIWNGSGKEGNGYLSTPGNALAETPYSFRSRFTNEAGTNPEELIAAAHAGCFTMKLSFVLAEAGYVPQTLETTAFISFENGAITASHLVVYARVRGIGRSDFDACIKEAEVDCPVSRVLRIAITTEVSFTHLP